MTFASVAEIAQLAMVDLLAAILKVVHSPAMCASMDQRLEKGDQFFYRVTSVNTCRRGCKTCSRFIQKNIRAKAREISCTLAGNELIGKDLRAHEHARRDSGPKSTISTGGNRLPH